LGKGTILIRSPATADNRMLEVTIQRLCPSPTPERHIAQKGFDETHVLRVVYEVFRDKEYIVTVYPGRRSRYEKD